MLRTPLLASGYELPANSEKNLESAEKNLVKTIVNVLERYTHDYKYGTQIEKAFASKRAIQKIIFSRQELEVFINIEDTTSSRFGQKRESLAVTGAREGAVPAEGRSANGGNPDAFAFAGLFESEKT